MKCAHQAAIDQGSFDMAWLLTGLPDPIRRERFGGEPEELEIIGQYIKAMNEVEKRSTRLPGHNDEEEPDKRPTRRTAGAKATRATATRATGVPARTLEREQFSSARAPGRTAATQLHRGVNHCRCEDTGAALYGGLVFGVARRWAADTSCYLDLGRRPFPIAHSFSDR